VFSGLLAAFFSFWHDLALMFSLLFLHI
jgi:hypothetical protein